jgi:hypothetical protein
MLQQDLQHRVMLARKREQGLPSFDEATASTVLVSVAGASMGSHPEQMLEAVIRKLTEFCRQPILEMTGNRALQPRDWARINKPDGSWAGQLRLRTIDYDEALRLHGFFHNTPLWNGTAWCHITVSNPHLPTTRRGGHPAREAGRPVRG